MVEKAENAGLCLKKTPAAILEGCLDKRSAQGDAYASYTLGRALAGIPCGALQPEALVTEQNLRRAVGLLMRAADGGSTSAWLHLSSICSDYRNSVANPTLARFCLEKAAHQGLPEAERRLGASIIRGASHIDPMEAGIALLASAAQKGDQPAKTLLRTFVHQVPGNENEAQDALEQIKQHAPLLAMRLQISRDFGLTKLEALSVNPALGMRPWGLFIGENPHVTKLRLAEPRVVPSLSRKVQDTLEQAVHLFSPEDRDDSPIEGPLRARSLQQRRIFQKLQINDDLFFARINCHQRDTLRIGTKWAQQQKQILQLATNA